MRVLVTGLHGQLVSALKLRSTAQFDVVAVGRPTLDLSTAKNIAPLLRAYAPDVVINAAAYTAVDRAETEPEPAFSINHHGAGAVAKAAHDLWIPIIQVSTDYVFDGTSTRPLLESDQTNPLGVYGASKLAGEIAVVAENPNHAILRASWIYSPFGSNFVRTMLRLAETRSEIRVVADQFGTPTSALDLATAIEMVALRLVREPENVALRGTFHMTASGGPVSWAEFAAEIFKQSSSRGGPAAHVTAIPTSEYPTAAKRPSYSCLDGGKLAATHGVLLPNWKEGLEKVMSRLAAGGFK